MWQNSDLTIMCRGHEKERQKMKYDFTTVYDRRGKDAVAIDEADHFYHNGAVLQEGFDQIPMWIADMNFATAPSIPQAMIERAKNPLYGYFPPRDEYYKSIIRWQLERNHVEGLTREKIGYEKQRKLILELQAVTAAEYLLNMERLLRRFQKRNFLIHSGMNLIIGMSDTYVQIF